MPIEYTFDPTRSLLIITARGSVGDEAMMEFVRKYAADPAVPPDCRKLVDLSDLEESTVSPAVVRRTADLLGGSGPSAGAGRTAMVAAQDFAYGLSRMYQSYRSASTESFRVFRERLKALEWLGVDPNAAP